MPITKWMSWEGGVDLVGATKSGLAMPNVLVHVARIVHTPVGSAPAGMISWQPDPSAAPAVIGFICADTKIGAYFGANIFAGTPFEHVPVLAAKITVQTSLPTSVSSRVEVAGHVFEVAMSDLGALELVNRAAGQPMPFAQQGLEARSKKVALKVDGKPVTIQVPDVGIGGGPGATWSPSGVYAR